MSKRERTGIGVSSMVVVLMLCSTKGNGNESSTKPCLDPSVADRGAPVNFRICARGIEMPLGRIVLLREGESYGAVRFNTYQRGKQNMFKATYYVTYDSWYQDDGSGDFLKSTTKHRTGNASVRLFGIGRMAFDFSHPEISCGSFTPSLLASGGMILASPEPTAGDLDLEFAPTKWTDISYVDVFDPRLKWYRRDEKRSCFDVAVDSLW